MNGYLEPDHPDAFADWPKQEPPLKWYPDKNIECPVCHGQGDWNLRLNAYSLDGKAETAENRHLFGHFRCHCRQCAGWGWVDPKDAGWVDPKDAGWVDPKDAGCVQYYGRELSLHS